jgi:excisionase family DNA binding protein
MPDGILTIDEAAEYLKVTRQTVHALINRGELRRFKVGRCSRIPAADVYALVGAEVPNGGDAA